MIASTWGRRALPPIRLALAAALLGPAGCAPAAVAPAPPGACRLATAATLEMSTDAASKPVIRVAAGNRTLRVWVDSGAETSVLMQQGADRLGIVADQGSRRIAGFGGQQVYGLAALPGLTFGGQVLRGLRWPVIATPGAGIDGLIGADLLAPYQVLFDFPAHRLTLYRAYGCAAVTPPWPAVALPWRDGLALPVVTAVLDGKPIDALIDTGAHWSVVDRAGAGLGPADLAQDDPVQSFGAGGMAFATRIHRFGSLRLGSLHITAPSLRVTDLTDAIPARLVIGDDLLAGHRLWLDEAGRRMFLGW